MDALHTGRQLEALRRLRDGIRRGEHVGAGLTLTVKVGGGDTEPIRLTVSAETDEIMLAIESGLVHTLKLSRILGLSEVTRIRDAIAAIEQTEGLDS